MGHTPRTLGTTLRFRGSPPTATTNPRPQPPGARDGRRDARRGGRERRVARERAAAQGSCYPHALSCLPTRVCRHADRLTFEGLAPLVQGDGEVFRKETQEPGFSDDGGSTTEKESDDDAADEEEPELEEPPDTGGAEMGVVD